MQLMHQFTYKHTHWSIKSK